MQYLELCYHRAIRLLGANKRCLNTVIVGANDGKTNDPIYEITLKYPSLFDMLLVEPLSSLHPTIKENYSHIYSCKVI